MNINELPVEMLEHIFQFLQFRHLKIASTVCRQWNQAAFSWPNLLKVKLIFGSDNICERTIPALEITHQRRYRNITFSFRDAQADQPLVHHFCKVLQEFQKSLESLEIDWHVQDAALDLLMLAKLLKYAPGLKELFVYDYTNAEFTHDPSCSLHFAPMMFLDKVRLPHSVMGDVRFNFAQFAPNVTHVDVKFDGRHPWDSIRALQEQLCALGIDTATQGNFKHLWSMEPRKLRKLELNRNDCDFIMPNDVKPRSIGNFFQHCSALTVLMLELKVPMEVYQIVADSCLQLESLLVSEIDDGWEFLSIVQHSKKLRRLIIVKTFFDSNQRYIRTTRLPNVQNLTIEFPEIYDTSRFFDQLNLLLPNIRTFQLTQYNKFLEYSFNLKILQALFRSKMQRLEKLILFDTGADFPSHLFNQLNLFPRLNEFWLTCEALAPWSRSAIVPGVRSLAVNAKISKFQLQALLKVFPSLTRLDVPHAEEQPTPGSLNCEVGFCKNGFCLESYGSL
ncbi:uncharacterized protein LOC129728820 [Wyeomyia smithii]|uniref:uncharacterized protein LOC129728820 n=1 Tax=Wyeomyia smithii TaxID=174621 RepID=UPI002467D488|nr:uncharacterized protein LOC129728820 [Wyeomyia smithii]